MRNLIKILKVAVVVITLAMIFYFVPNRQLNVEYISQYPNMPNGCEITSLAMVMNYNGYDVSKEYLNDNFLEKSGFRNADPDKAYIGSPYNNNGYYTYAAPIANAANKYFSSIGAHSKATDVTGKSIFGVLNSIIIYKKPVIVWYTIDDESPRSDGNTYVDAEGNRQSLYSNLHCLVVEGTGMGKIKVVDPTKGKRKINFLQFAKLYFEMGQRAVIIK